MNKTNLELKHYCPDFVSVRRVLKSLGAQKDKVTKQKDFFFELPKKKGGNPRLKLRIENGKHMLIFYDRPDFKAGKQTKALIKIYETKSPELLPVILEALGVSAVVEKTREIWRKENTVFHLDNVKGVGNIFEVELQKHGAITAGDKKIFQAYQGALLPHLGKVINGSNVDLVKKNK